MTGELTLFKALWNTRKRSCWVCNAYIPHFSPFNFHHILTKAAYPAFRLRDKNIVILCNGCHVLAHEKAQSDLLKNPLWAKYFELRDILKTAYYRP
jgi:hypothetical protein